jgi:glycosyltransferase involved in cell wall biosynthesis
MSAQPQDRPIRIAITADPELPVPPELYGGIERMIDGLVRTLTDQGYAVTLFAHPSSSVPCELVPWPGASSSSPLHTARNAACLVRAVLAGRFDLIHSFSRLAYLWPLLPWSIPKLMTYQRPITRRSVQRSHALSRGSLHFTAISQWMLQPVEGIGDWHVVPNGVPLDTYTFIAEPGPEAPLLFLGRLEEIKGPHLAIEIAQRTGLPLVLAGNVPTEHKQWFAQHIQPKLDPQRIRYVGPVNDAQKAELIGQCRALLMPLLWDEPFGIVMAEAMACGTPVLGLNRGAVPEVVEHGVTGFVASTLEELIDQVPQLPQLDRAACRQRVERLYSTDAMATSYLRVYRSLLWPASA